MSDERINPEVIEAALASWYGDDTLPIEDRFGEPERARMEAAIRAADRERDSQRAEAFADIKRTVHHGARGFPGEIEIRFEVPYIQQPRVGVVVRFIAPAAPTMLVSTSAAIGFGADPEDVERLRYAMGLAADEVREITRALDEGRSYDPDWRPVERP